MKYYDWHQWKAKVYRTPEEIVKGFAAFGLGKKVIKRVDFIGIADNLLDHNLDRDIREVLRTSGIPYEKMKDWEYYPDATLPCQAVLCEPLVITFEDGSTFEMLPQPDGALKMSVNRLSGDMFGLNHPNVDASKLFKNLIGARIDRVAVRRFTTEGYDGHWERRSKYAIQFYTRFSGGRDFGQDCGFELVKRGEGWYTVCLTNQHHFTYDGNKAAEITLAELNEALIPKEQIMIVEGHDSSSYFWIMPVRQDPQADMCVEEFCREEISIEEYDVYELLYYFLYKYFDEDFPYICRDQYCSSGFEWHLEHNIYTYDSISAMLSEIRQAAKMLQEDFDNPALDALKEKMCLGVYLPKDTPYAQRNEALRGRIHLAVDFYDQFCRRMEAMMKNAPQYELISFMGP